MKSLLIIETPKNCVGCRLNDDNNGYPMCVYLHSSHGSLAFHFNGDKERNPYCPLRPLPEKKERESWGDNEYAIYNNLHKMGWNDCIDYILGETE